MAEQINEIAPTPEPVEFTGNDLADLLKLHEEVFDLAEKTQRRVVVEVWDRGDRRAVAWFEVHPDDSEVTVTFTRPDPSEHGHPVQHNMPAQEASDD